MPEPTPRAMTAVPLGEVTAKRTQPNVLVLDYCDLEAKGKLWADVVTVRADALCHQAHGARTRQQADGPEPEAAGEPHGAGGGLHRHLSLPRRGRARCPAWSWPSSSRGSIASR